MVFGWTGFCLFSAKLWNLQRRWRGQFSSHYHRFRPPLLHQRLAFAPAFPLIGLFRDPPKRISCVDWALLASPYFCVVLLPAKTLLICVNPSHKTAPFATPKRPRFKMCRVQCRSRLTLKKGMFTKGPYNARNTPHVDWKFTNQRSWKEEEQDQI